MKSFKISCFFVFIILYNIFTFSAHASQLAEGDLVKIKNSSLVYYIDNIGEKHLFTEPNVFSSWYNGTLSDLGVKIITKNELNSIPSSSNITVRPGYLIKFTNDNNYYSSLPEGNMCVISNTAAVVSVYGRNWKNRVIKIKDINKKDYSIDSACIINKDSKIPDGSIIKYINSSDIYYINHGLKRKFYDNEFITSGFNKKLIINNISPIVFFEDAGMEYKVFNDFAAEQINVRRLNIKDCYQALNISQRNKCYLDLANRDLNISFCSHISDMESKTTCYQYIAGQKKNSNICNYIKDLGGRAECFTTVALATGNKNICGYISNTKKDLRNVCLSYFEKPKQPSTNDCDASSDMDIRTSCYVDLAVSLNDETVCGMLNDAHYIGLCYYSTADRLSSAGLATVERSAIICSKISERHYEDLCFAVLGYHQNRSDICNNIVDPDIKKTCYH